MQAVGGDPATKRPEHACSVELDAELVGTNDVKLSGIGHDRDPLPWARHTVRLCA